MGGANKENSISVHRGKLEFEEQCTSHHPSELTGAGHAPLMREMQVNDAVADGHLASAVALKFRCSASHRISMSWNFATLLIDQGGQVISGGKSAFDVNPERVKRVRKISPNPRGGEELSRRRTEFVAEIPANYLNLCAVTGKASAAQSDSRPDRVEPREERDDTVGLKLELRAVGKLVSELAQRPDVLFRKPSPGAGLRIKPGELCVERGDLTREVVKHHYLFCLSLGCLLISPLFALFTGYALRSQSEFVRPAPKTKYCYGGNSSDDYGQTGSHQRGEAHKESPRIPPNDAIADSRLHAWTHAIPKLQQHTHLPIPLWIGRHSAMTRQPEACRA